MNRRLALCLGLLAAVGSAQGAENAEPQWQTVRAGVSYAQQEVAVAQSDLIHRLHWLRIDLRQADLEVALTPQQCAGLRLMELDRDKQVVASINASFFSRDFHTRGHTVSDSRPWAGVYRVTESPLLACGADRQCQVIHQPPAQALPGWRNAASGVYSLVVEGVVRTEQDDALCGAFCETTHPRSALGLDASRRWLYWLAAEGRQKNVAGLALHRLAVRMQAVGVADAVNFDGGGSTGMHVLGQALAVRPDDEPSPRRVANAWVVLGTASPVLSEASTLAMQQGIDWAQTCGAQTMP